VWREDRGRRCATVSVARQLISARPRAPREVSQTLHPKPVMYGLSELYTVYDLSGMRVPPCRAPVIRVAMSGETHEASSSPEKNKKKRK
jgi:hypothetical protein